ncbi:AAEL014258-PA [Aedes aegypti]|uniref:AAEL014258-PA n=1 Tax=Aedes aegypti TaxID=7159 RepID=Q16GV0_AEDAE|nr:AAEL014258-PA [Aedes aegypti]
MGKASQVCLDQPIRPQSLISDDLEIQPKYENKFLHAVYHPSMPDPCRAPLNAALLAECDNSGSLFSIQSAPVVPTSLSGPGESTLNGGIPGSQLPIDPMGVDAMLDRQRDSYPGATGPLISPLHCNTLPKEDHRTDTLLRPSSLAFDTGYHVVKPLVEPQLSAELDEDDNENLLTVSSLTARPLIAKSRELRSKKEKLIKRRKKVSTETSSEDDEEGPPDGGYGWVIVFGAFSVQFWVAGLVKSYGVLYVEILENFPDSSATTASWIPAILSALCLALAPVSSALCQRFSPRIVVIIGGVFCALGLTMSYFATSLYHLLLTFGVLTGIGGGLSTTPGIVIVSQYFEKRRALANGITISGTAAGSFIFPMLIERLIQLFGFHGTILILGGCMLHVCVSGALYRPVDDSAQKKPNPREIAPYTSRMDFKDNLGHLSSSEDHLSRRCLEDLFLDETVRADKNRNSLNLDGKFVNVTEKTLQESEDELKDIISNAIFLKPIASIKSCSILHSVEDLSTDSTFVYKNRGSGYDSQRNSKRLKQRNEEMYNRIHQQKHQQQDILLPPKTEQQQQPQQLPPQTQGLTQDASHVESTEKAPKSEWIIGGDGGGNNNNNNNNCPLSQNRGLSKSMIIPTPARDLSNIFDDDEYEEYSEGLLDKISQ